MAGMSELPPEVADLYREPPAGFIAARDALAAELKGAGRDDDAGTVKKLRKPTLPVWAVDQLGAREPKLVAQLLDAGAELRAAQQATLSSAEAAERLRTATATRREVVAKLTASAVAALGEIGAAGGTQADTIAAALESASIDTQVGERLRTGTLTALPDAPGGFGDVFGLSAVPDLPAGTRKAAPAAKPDAAKRKRLLESAKKMAQKDRALADRLARDLAQTRERLAVVEAEHAAAESKALESEAAAKRAERDLG